MLIGTGRSEITIVHAVQCSSMCFEGGDGIGQVSDGIGQVGVRASE